jgi:hypothetical protein
MGTWNFLKIEHSKQQQNLFTHNEIQMAYVSVAYTVAPLASQHEASETSGDS